MSTRHPLPALLLAWALATTLLAGCGEIKVRAGTPVATSMIEARLTLGQSSAEEVRQALGEPVGMGREFLPFHDQPRTVWSYHFEESQVSLSGGGDSHRVFVWIFLKDARYDGYLWVSSFPADRAAP
jgi:CubicO group peptidase (beta-lactamase class C family)